jgi:superfamily I DNA/RNA helicase
LYNFFEDSPFDASRWRLVLNLSEQSSGVTPAPGFDDVRHAGICTEVKNMVYSKEKIVLTMLRRQLKFLYVAITRARKNLWIFDNSEKAYPMKVSVRNFDSVWISCGPQCYFRFYWNR